MGVQEPDAGTTIPEQRKEPTMSIAEFGLKPRESFISTLAQMRSDQPLAKSETPVGRYEALSRLSLSLASLTPEELSRKLASLLRPVLDFDFVDAIVFKEGTSDALWHSNGAGPLPSSDVPMEE